jgi:hypothetical protein
MGSFALLGICISAWVTNVATCKMSVALTELESGMKDIINNRDPIVVEYNKDNELGHLVNSYNKLIEKLGK